MSAPRDALCSSRRAAIRAALLLLLFPALLAFGAPPPLETVSPASVGLSAARLSRIDALLSEAIARQEVPGAVVLVGRHGKVAFRKAYGHRALEPAVEPMTVDTAFDLASLTKGVATAAAVMTLVEEGRVALDEPVVRYLPEFGSGGGERERVTVEQLLTHRSGLVADDPMSLYDGTPDEIFARKHRTPLSSPPGRRFVYSDAGYEVLGELVRAVTGEPLDAYARRAVFEPLGMRETEFRPAGKGGRLAIGRIAPTEKRDGAYLRGEVHDPRARALGGVAGHAGLFSTADDLARFARALVGNGDGWLSPAAVAATTRARDYGDGDLRALGWDVETHYSTSRGDLFPLGSWGHTGWTGTSMWLDPATDTFVILLSARNHPGGAGNAVPLRTRLASVVAAAVEDVPADALRRASERLAGLTGRPPAPLPRGPAPSPEPLPYEVRAGVDVLESSGFEVIAGRRVALLTNATGVTRDGRTTLSVLLSPRAKAAGVRVVRLFSPEHGLAAALDEKVGDSVESGSGLPVVSLYGEKRRPSPADLAGLDTLVVDLQDAGVRFYTYLTTMAWAMEECAKAKVAVVVLDRPNPIGGVAVEGPPADPDRLSFVAVHTIPIRTGMTVGETARMLNAERRIGADLEIIPLRGWRRALWYDETGLPWVNPSPNLRSVTQAALYPGVALLETTNVSVGRGTDAPFELVGAPWIDAERLARMLNLRAIPGVRFAPVAFTPASSTHAGSLCRGVRITLTDRSALRPVALGLELATALRDLHRTDWNRDRFGELLGSAAALVRFERGEAAGTIVAGWAAEQMEFERRRARFLLYE
ncbi:MAG: exo-beta-N-acetylmuramidase NamZ domain-containing protein [Thermoanaerobaculia bacterium]